MMKRKNKALHFQHNIAILKEYLHLSLMLVINSYNNDHIQEYTIKV